MEEVDRWGLFKQERVSVGASDDGRRYGTRSFVGLQPGS